LNRSLRPEASYEAVQTVVLAIVGVVVIGFLTTTRTTICWTWISPAVPGLRVSRTPSISEDWRRNTTMLPPFVCKGITLPKL